jgi:predicted nucleic acid-binding protein
VSRFLDTNVLVYAQAAGERGERARDVVRSGGLVSVQVLNEFVSVLRRKAGLGWPSVEDALADVRAAVESVQPLTVETSEAAVAIARDHAINIYDALIVASALEARCRELVSEDFQHGRMFGTLQVRNPFL